jgi:hypothetical protein
MGLFGAAPPLNSVKSEHPTLALALARVAQRAQERLTRNHAMNGRA